MVEWSSFDRVVVDGEAIPASHEFDASGGLSLSLPREAGKFYRKSSSEIGVDVARDGTVAAPMPGLIVELIAKPGASVERGETLAVIEAMKMRHRITADVDGDVRETSVEVGDQVAFGDVILRIDPNT